MLSVVAGINRSFLYHSCVFSKNKIRREKILQIGKKRQNFARGNHRISEAFWPQKNHWLHITCTIVCFVVSLIYINFFCTVAHKFGGQIWRFHFKWVFVSFGSTRRIWGTYLMASPRNRRKTCGRVWIRCVPTLSWPLTSLKMTA